ncbi:hypothetical protein Slin15195_G105770 [Septoria linicola]|uniref:Uncharacterized protein n=1 Tax=Septoria linicola TaxID=215465 RepID=A0A9Q9EQ79_9PEZI|nr:hypothetical protein Slin15195_G105770 [Septoria linicola]
MSSTISSREALCIAYAHNTRTDQPIATKLAEEILQIGEHLVDDWYDDVEQYLNDHPDEKAAPVATLVAAWAAFRRAGQAGDREAMAIAASIWETGTRVIRGWQASVNAWCAANSRFGACLGEDFEA